MHLAKNIQSDRNISSTLMLLFKMKLVKMHRNTSELQVDLLMKQSKMATSLTEERKLSGGSRSMPFVLHGFDVTFIKSNEVKARSNDSDTFQLDICWICGEVQLLDQWSKLITDFCQLQLHIT